jgi:hypothetical protein
LVIGAQIAVVAVGEAAPGATARDAMFSDGAGIGVVAGHPLVGRNDGTAPVGRIAGGGLAETAGARFRKWALNNAFLIDLALIREAIGVADQGAIAQVAIFQRLAIVIALALAVYGYASADPVFAFVGHGARVTVIALRAVVGERAAAQAVAKVVRAGV